MSPYIIPGIIRLKAPKVDEIISTVADHYGVSVLDIKGISRKRNIVLARHVAMYFVYKKTELSQENLAPVFECNRTMINYATKMINNYVKTKNETVCSDLYNLNILLSCR